MIRLIVVAAMLLAASCASVDLSPSHWAAKERARIEGLELGLFPPSAREVSGRELVAATMSPIATHAGMEALRQGGTAADAAITTALTQVAVNAGAVVSYAGVMELVYYEASTGKVHVLDAGWRGYANERDPASIPRADLSLVTGKAGGAQGSGRQTLVPGFMAGMEAAHARFGRLGFAGLLAPAIHYAREGITVSPLLDAYFGMRAPLFVRSTDGRVFLGNAEGQPPKAGQRFTQRDLADTLEAVARDGAGHIYSGAWAQRFVDAVRADGGAASMQDLAAYEPVWTPPLSVEFGDVRVFGPDTSNASSCQILEALNLMNARGRQASEPYWRDVSSFVELASVLKFAVIGHYLPTVLDAERKAGLPPTCEARTSPAYAKAMAHVVDTLEGPRLPAEAGHHSASVVAVDRWGNVAALVHSGNSVVWGDTGIVVGGIPLPNPGGIYQSRLQAAGPGKRIAGDLSPVIALRGGKPTFAIAAIGSSVVPETVRLAAGVQGGVDLAALAAAPPVLLNVDAFTSANAAAAPEMVPKDAYAPEFTAELAKAGLATQDVDASRVAALRGTAAIGVMKDGAAQAAEAPGVLVHVDAR